VTRRTLSHTYTTVVLGGEKKGELRHLCGLPGDRFNDILLNAVVLLVKLPMPRRQSAGPNHRPSRCKARLSQRASPGKY
jgi:hypothetical protein